MIPQVPFHLKLYEPHTEFLFYTPNTFSNHPTRVSKTQSRMVDFPSKQNTCGLYSLGFFPGSKSWPITIESNKKKSDEFGTMSLYTHKLNMESDCSD